MEPATEAVEFDDSLTHATAQVRPQDVLYLQPDRILRNCRRLHGWDAISMHC